MQFTVKCLHGVAPPPSPQNRWESVVKCWKLAGGGPLPSDVNWMPVLSGYRSGEAKMMSCWDLSQRMVNTFCMHTMVAVVRCRVRSRTKSRAVKKEGRISWRTLLGVVRRASCDEQMVKWNERQVASFAGFFAWRQSVIGWRLFKDNFKGFT